MSTASTTTLPGTWTADIGDERSRGDTRVRAVAESAQDAIGARWPLLVALDASLAAVVAPIPRFRVMPAWLLHP